MICPLVKYIGVEFLNPRRYNIFADDCYIKTRNKFINAVVDFGVYMVRSAGKHHYLFALFFGFFNNLVALCDYLFSVLILFVISKFCGLSYLVKSKVGEIF